MSTPPEHGGLGLAVLIVDTSNEIAGEQGLTPAVASGRNSGVSQPSASCKSWHPNTLNPKLGSTSIWLSKCRPCSDHHGHANMPWPQP
jgi:hypothetical protein